ISASLYGRFVPIIDCDSIPEYNEAREYLLKRDVRFAVFQSSKQPHYWIIPDMSFATFEEAWKTFCYVPGSDHKYLRLSKKYNYFRLRAELKEAYDIPKLIYVNCQNPN